MLEAGVRRGSETGREGLGRSMKGEGELAEEEERAEEEEEGWSVDMLLVRELELVRVMEVGQERDRRKRGYEERGIFAKNSEGTGRARRAACP
jgi:hypothetical protein